MGEREYPKLCKNTGCSNYIMSPRQGRCGYCRSCRAWMKTHGSMRPTNTYHREPVPCAECQELMAPGNSRKGRCRSCASKLDRQVKRAAVLASRAPAAAASVIREKVKLNLTDDADRRAQLRPNRIDIDTRRHDPVMHVTAAGRYCPRCNGRMVPADVSQNMHILACLACGEQAYV